jgi:hypothetical protein
MPKSRKITAANTTLGDIDLAKEGIRMSFPVKLYQMLEQAEERGFSQTVSWNKEGNGFCVSNIEVFVRDIIPQYYAISKYKSFQVSNTVNLSDIMMIGMCSDDSDCSQNLSIASIVALWLRKSRCWETKGAPIPQELYPRISSPGSSDETHHDQGKG